MTTIDWILKLKAVGVLTEGIKNDKAYLHLKTPCKVHLSASATRQLRDCYEAEQEKGGVMVSIPQRIDNITYLTIDRVICITNISATPNKSYKPDERELNQALNETFSSQKENSLPIRFHTHPTHSDNPVNEMFNYVFQSNISEQDQLVSDTPWHLDDLKILMPRCLVLCNGNRSDRMFIGFYNGMIAPIEFETHRQIQTQKAIDSIYNNVSEWVKEGNNKWWLIGGGVLLAVLVIRYNKLAIPLILLLVAMSPIFINDQYGPSNYFAQVRSGAADIEFP